MIAEIARENSAIEATSKARLAIMTAASASGSPSTARAGHHSALPALGACAISQSDCNAAKRDRLPELRIATTCRPITKAAPITAATICAISRVRLAPMVRNSATVSATATAAATAPMAATTA